MDEASGRAWPELLASYVAGASLPDLHRSTGIPLSTLRHRIMRAGLLRGRAEAVRLAAEQGKWSHTKGRRREFTPEWRLNVSRARLHHAEVHAAGVSHKKSGYVVYTRGPHKGRNVHVVEMEIRIGRSLLPDECVHHIDGDRSNNDPNNLALMTRSGHTRLHRLQDALANNVRERDSNGRFT